MRFVQFFFSLALTAALAWTLGQSFTFKEKALPPLGNIFNPFSGFWQNAVFENKQFPKTLTFPQLDHPVTVIYDDRLVPHLFAGSQRDAYFVQGYITAQHRLWQMDITARSASGRLSEVVGPKAFQRDRLQRRKGMVFAAQNALKRWQQSDQFSNIQAYTSGVNAYIDQLKPADYPIEFKLMNYAPENITELNVALLAKSMAETLCARETDLEATNALAILGQETFDEIFPLNNPKQSPVIPTEIQFKASVQNPIFPSPLSDLGTFRHQPIPKPDPFLGSNNWAVSGSKSATGSPILCNDPHLKLTLPSIWFEMQIHTPAYNVYGVTLPGMPGVIIGFNQDIAWGITNVGQDVMDWYRIQWTDESRNHYLLDNQSVEVTKTVETYRIQGMPPVQDTVRYTVWGPVVYEDSDQPRHDLALHWLAHEEPVDFDMNTFSELDLASNYQDYLMALSHFHSPPQNFAFASKDGDIALVVQGHFPLKTKDQGRFIMDGSLSGNAWKGYIPQQDNPRVKNPARGFVASANQNSTSPDYPYPYHGEFDDYRGRFLNRSLAALSNATADDMKALQNSNYSLQAEEELPLLLSQLEGMELTAKEKEYLRLLQDWKYSFDANLAAPILFDQWSDIFYHKTWDEIYRINDTVSMLFPETWRTIDLLENDPQNRCFDLVGTEKIETAVDIVRSSFQQMCSEVSDWEKEHQNLEWKNFKILSIKHLGNIPAFTRDHIPVGGSGESLNAIKTTTGPSWRMVVELGDNVTAYGVYPGGQSGNPGSRFYDNMIDDWAAGKYYSLKYMQTPADTIVKPLYQQQFEK